MDTILTDFLKAKLSLEQLKKALGNDLYNINIKEPQRVYAKDVIDIINQYTACKISTKEIVDWVNVIWFTDLYEYNVYEEESISGVISVLETLDEADVQISREELFKMIECLSNNEVYENRV